MGRSVPEVMAELAVTGLSPYQLALITELAVAAASTGNPVDKAAEKRREYDRERKRKLRGIPPDSTGLPPDFPETPLISSSPSLSTNEGSEERKEENKRASKRKSTGHPLPADWQPHGKHYVTGEALGLGRAAVDGLADEMRHWAKSNGHRPIAKKSDWNSAFYGWINRAPRSNGHRPLTPSEQQKVKSDAAFAKLKEFNQRPVSDIGSSDADRDVPEGHGGGPGDVLSWPSRTAGTLPTGGNSGGRGPVEWDRGNLQVFAIAGRNQG